MGVKTLCADVAGVYHVNCYLHVDEASGHCFIIDPGAEPERLLKLVREQSLTVERILLTHGHFDHIGGVAYLAEALGVPCHIHEAGLRYLEDPILNLSASFDPITLSGVSVMREGDSFVLEGNPTVRLSVLHMPGHTLGSVVFYDEGATVAFVGDTIFSGGVGTWEYPGGNREQLIRSVMRILGLPAQTSLLSGHSGPWTVADARARLLR